MGGSDCEAIHDGWLAQPVNAWSSLVFIVAGTWLLARTRSASVDRLPCAAGGVALALVGIGSFAYHGPQPSWGGVAHDGSIALLLAIIAVVVLGRLRPPRRLPATPRVAVVTLALGGVAWILGRTDAPLCDPDSVIQLHAAWHALAALAAFWFFERNGAIGGRNRSKDGP